MHMMKERIASAVTNFFRMVNNFFYTSMHCLLNPPSVVCGHKIIFLGVHFVMEDMSFRLIFLEIVHVHGGHAF